METIDWNERVSQIKVLRAYITENTDKFADNKNLQVFWGMLNRELIELNESRIDHIIKQINEELYD